jgi:hypothetical protein
MKTLAISAFLLTGLISSAASAQCDLTGLECWGPHKKCNIKFKNETGMGSGSGGGTGHDQVSSVATIKVSARKGDNTRAGSNTLQIAAGANKTMNLDKKQGFDKIRIENVLGGRSPKLTCDDIKKTLNGSGICKVFKALDPDGILWLAVTCNNAEVVVIAEKFPE